MEIEKRLAIDVNDLDPDEMANFTGDGIYKFTDGSVYKGQWEEGQKHGFGELRYNDEKVFCGRFKANKPWEGQLMQKDSEGLRIDWYIDGEHIGHRQFLNAELSKKEFLSIEKIREVMNLLKDNISKLLEDSRDKRQFSKVKSKKLSWNFTFQIGNLRWKIVGAAFLAGGVYLAKDYSGNARDSYLDNFVESIESTFWSLNDYVADIIYDPVEVPSSVSSKSYFDNEYQDNLDSIDLGEIKDITSDIVDATSLENTSKEKLSDLIKRGEEVLTKARASRDPVLNEYADTLEAMIKGAKKKLEKAPEATSVEKINSLSSDIVKEFKVSAPDKDKIKALIESAEEEIKKARDSGDAEVNTYANTLELVVKGAKKKLNQ